MSCCSGLLDLSKLEVVVASDLRRIRTWIYAIAGSDRIRLRVAYSPRSGRKGLSPTLSLCAYSKLKPHSMTIQSQIQAHYAVKIEPLRQNYVARFCR